MPTEQTTSPALERLAAEEIDSLRRRFADGDGIMPDLRADGASTLEDVAEAFGVSPAEVRRQLDRIREERAIAPVAKARRDQRGLLVFACFLLGSAYAIHVLNPRPLSDEEREANMERALAESRARHRDRPRPVHYPIETVVKTGALPPEGFAVQFQGLLTTTKMGVGPPGPLEQGAAQAALEKALFNGIQAARDAERQAPAPTKPLPITPFSGREPKAGSFMYSVGGPGFGMTGQIDLAPRGNGSTEADDHFFARNTAASAVENAMRRQEESLRLDAPRFSGNVQPPAGYSVEFAGRQKSTFGVTLSLVVLPIDEARVALKLEQTVRNMIWKDAEPPDFSTPSMHAEQAKRPIPAFADLTITGPLGPVEISLPMTASSKYPTAADAMRAADPILAKGIREAAAQIGELSRGVRKK